MTKTQVGSGLIVASKLKIFIKECGMQSSADLAEVLDGHVTQILADAIKRAKSNDRATVREQDL